MMPRIIYVFWHEGEAKLPVFIAACLRRMRKMCPSFTIVVLDNDSLGPLPKGYHSLRVAHKSDWAKVCKIAETGGIWIDISCVLLKPVESWVDMQSDALQGFCFPSDRDIMENWAFAAPRACKLVLLWREEFRTAIERGLRHYIAENTPPASLKDHVPYLTQHLALHVARSKAPWEPIVIHNSEDGPFMLHKMCNWKLCEHYHTDALPDIPFIKMRGDEVKQIRASPLSDMERILEIRIEKRHTAISIVLSILVLVCLKGLCPLHPRNKIRD